MKVDVMYVCGSMCIETFKRRITRAAYKVLWVISNIMLFKSSYATKKLKNKTTLCLNNIVCITVWSLVIHSNCFVVYYQLMLNIYVRSSITDVCFMFSSV